MDAEYLNRILGGEDQLRKMIAAIHNIESAVVSLSSKLEGSAGKFGEQLERADDRLDSIARNSEAIGKGMEHVVDVTQLAIDKIDKFAVLAQKVKETLASISMKGFMEGMGSKAQYMLSGEGVSGQAESLVNSIPYIGPAATFMMRAEKQRQEALATGRSAYVDFEKSGHLSPSEIRTRGNRLGGHIQDLEISRVATAQDVSAVFKTFIEEGAKADDMTKKVGITVKGFGDTVADVALGIDKQFSLASGSTATFSATLSRDTGASLQESVRLVQELGQASHATGANMQVFLGTILQVTSALRIQGSDAKDVATAFYNMEQSFRQTRGTKAGETDLRSTSLAQSATTGLGSFFSNLPRNLQGLIARKVAIDLNVPNAATMGDVELLNGMDNGFDGTNPAKFQSLLLRHTWNGIGEDSTSAAEKSYYLKTQGMNKELARYLEKKGPEGLFASNDLETAKKAQAIQDKVDEDQAKVQPLRNNDFNQKMDEIAKVFSSIGQLLFQGLMMIVEGIGGLPGAMLDPTRAIKYGSRMQKRSAALSDAGRRLVSSLGVVGGDIFGPGFLGGEDDEDGTTETTLQSTKTDKFEEDEVSKILQRELPSKAKQLLARYKEEKGFGRGYKEFFKGLKGYGEMTEEQSQRASKEVETDEGKWLVEFVATRIKSNPGYVPRGNAPETPK